MTFQRYTPPAGAEMKPDSKGQFYLASEVDKEIKSIEAAWLNAEAQIEELKSQIKNQV